MAKKVKRVVVETETTEDIVCNFCGNSTQKYGDYFVYAVLHFDPGYGSKCDGQEHESHVCEECYKWLMGMMSIPPTKIRDYDAVCKDLAKAYAQAGMNV